MPNCRRLKIIRAYLNAGENVESCVRQRENDGDYIVLAKMIADR